MSGGEIFYVTFWNLFLFYRYDDSEQPPSPLKLWAF
uniref:Uncharacterized protein n=1 Tax=Podoviridae sp. ct53O25 TaxID=2826539 RepID=A0A8S5MBI1_9CAUD|nr:MAG TPA: hypothetical protein [Podoviridae sp. ct53O25]